MKKQNISIVITVRAKSKEEAKRKLVILMNNAVCNLDLHDDFPEWGFHSDYKLADEKVKK